MSIFKKTTKKIMCGIAGIFCKFPQNLANECAQMANAISHRGPDDFGYLAINPNQKIQPPIDLHKLPEGNHTIFLAHRRLSIIDVCGSKQPLSNEDGSIWTIFNGEIYNYCEIRNTLIAKNHTLRENGDTEVLVHLWEDYKENMLEHLTGMFAFAIYDSNSHSLFLARDRFGEKPLYYTYNNSFFAFASELQAFFHLPYFNTFNINKIALAQFLRYGFIPSPNTIYDNLHSLPPGHYLILQNEHFTIKQYWKPTVVSLIKSPDINLLQSLLDESVKLRLRADVPIGSFLSGGIDSALITASICKQSHQKISSFTISSDKKFWEDESELAQLTANHLQTKHHLIVVQPDIIQAAEKLALHYGQPYADHSSIITYYLCKEAVKYIKVALTGDGGDELFAGYGSYLNLPFYSIVGLIPYTFRKSSAKLLNFLPNLKGRNNSFDACLSSFSLPRKGENIAPLFHQYWRNFAYNPDFAEFEKKNDEQISLFSNYFKRAKSSNLANKWMEADQQLYLPDDILVKLDIASMASSLECRAPFLDHHLANFANSIHINDKTKFGISKFLLKEIAKNRLPKIITQQPKKGFSFPLSHWIKTNLKDWLYSTIFNNNPLWHEFLKKEAIEQMWNEHIHNIHDHQGRIWQIASIELWKKNCYPKIFPSHKI